MEKSINSSARYPSNRDNWLLTTAIGGALLFLGFLLVPIVLVYGYLVRVIKTTQDGDTEPPEFGDWGELLVDGIKALAIGIVYMLVPILVAAATVGTALFSLGSGGNTGATAGGLVFGFAVSTLLALLFGYVAAAAIVNFAREDDIGAAFDFGVLRRILSHRDYAMSWLVSVASLLVAGIVGSLPIVGWLLAPFVSFYALSVAGNLLSSGVSAALDPVERRERTRGKQPVA